MIKNIVFDLGNVIAPFNPLEIYKDVCKDDDLAHQLYHHFNSLNIWHNFDMGESIEEVKNYVLANTPKELQTVAEKIVLTWVDYLGVDQEMVEYLFELKEKGYNLFILSNFSLQYPQYVNKHDFFLLFDGLYFSGFHKKVKPEAEIYEHFLQLYQLNADECIFIDDRIENVQGAMDCGLHGFHYTNNLDQLKTHLVSL